MFCTQRIVPVAVQTASVLDSNVLRDAVPVCAGDVMGASVAVVMTVDVAKVAVKQLSARNAVSETRAQTEWLFQSNCSSPANFQCGPSCKCSSCDDNSCCQCTCDGASCSCDKDKCKCDIDCCRRIV